MALSASPFQDHAMPLGQWQYSPMGNVDDRSAQPADEDWWDEQDELLEEQLAEKSCRGLTHGYVRSEMERARALVIGCNYPQARSMRLWGACADARQWASTLTERLGVPARNMALLADETADGKLVENGDALYPSQRNVLEHLRWLTSDVQSGDLLVFIFCGRGTMLLEDDADVETPQDEDDDEPIQEGLLCADFESADWVNGTSMRLLTNRAAAGFWESLPKGTALTVVLDCEHALSMLPVSRRLDGFRLPAELCLGSEPMPVLEALAFDVALMPAVARRIREAEANAVPAGMPVPADPHRGARGSQGVWPERRWLRGQMFWEVAAGTDEPGAMDPDVQAFAFAASGRAGHAYESLLSRKLAKGKLQDTAPSAPLPGQAPGIRRKGGPGKRRGVLTHCLLQALEELNFQGTYYALWWKATRVMLSEGYRDQHFQLTFSDGTDPTCREAFAAVGDAEARAFDRRTKLDQVLADQAAPMEAQCGVTACDGGREIEGIAPDDPLFSARGSQGCGCGVLAGSGALSGDGKIDEPPPCSLM